jgi:hypothetical protein
MTHMLAMWDVLPKMTSLPIQPIDRPAVVRRMVQFLSAGLRAPLTEMPAEQARPAEQVQEERN